MEVRRAIFAVAAIVCCAQVADACPRCGRSYCNGCYKPKSKALLPYGTNKAKAKPLATAPLAEQGATVVLKVGQPDLFAMFREYLAGRPLFGTAGERNMARAATADQNAFSVLQQVAKGQLDERNILAYNDGIRALQTTTETRTETSTTTTTGDVPADDPIPNPVGPLGAAVAHPFHAVAIESCASCHSGAAAKGRFRVNDQATWDLKEIRRRMDPATVTGHMPPGKQLSFEARDRAR